MTVKRRNQAIVGVLIFVALVLLLINRVEVAEWLDRNLFVHKGRWEKGDDPNESKFNSCAVRTQQVDWPGVAARD